MEKYLEVQAGSTLGSLGSVKSLDWDRQLREEPPARIYTAAVRREATDSYSPTRCLGPRTAPGVGTGWSSKSAGRAAGAGMHST